MLKILRWVFAAFTFVVCGFSLALLVLSCIGYSQIRAAFDEMQTQRSFDVKEDEFMSRFKPQAALALFYVGIAFGLVFMLVSFMGCFGGYYMDKCYLIMYGAVMGVLLIGSMAGIAIGFTVKRKEFEDIIINVYNEFAKYLYGQDKQVLASLLKGIIESTQKNHHCCGILDKKTEKETNATYRTTMAQYAVLFWIEESQWGQIQLANIAKDLLAKNANISMLFTPISCCKKISPKCSEGIYEDHFQWSKDKQERWDKTIWTDGCGQYLLDFQHLAGNQLNTLIAFTVIGVLVFIASIVLAFVLALCKKKEEDKAEEEKAPSGSGESGASGGSAHS